MAVVLRSCFKTAAVFSTGIPGYALGSTKIPSVFSSVPRGSSPFDIPTARPPGSRSRAALNFSVSAADICVYIKYESGVGRVCEDGLFAACGEQIRRKAVPKSTDRGILRHGLLGISRPAGHDHGLCPWTPRPLKRPAKLLLRYAFSFRTARSDLPVRQDQDPLIHLSNARSVELWNLPRQPK